LDAKNKSFKKTKIKNEVKSGLPHPIKLLSISEEDADQILVSVFFIEKNMAI